MFKRIKFKCHLFADTFRQERANSRPIYGLSDFRFYYFRMSNFTATQHSPDLSALYAYYRSYINYQDGTESVPIQLAQCRFPAKILIYFSYKIRGSNFIKQYSETVMV